MESTEHGTPTIKIIDDLLTELAETKEFLDQGRFRPLKLPPLKKDLKEWSRLLENQRLHSSQRFTIMVLGEYNAGKSTLLNVLLDLPEERRLPALDDPTTAKPIRLTYRGPDDPEATLVKHDNSEESSTWEAAINEATTQLGELVEDVKEIKVYLDHPLLQEADIVDMPGTGTAWYERHSEITRDYVSRSEMVIWVIGSEMPSNESKKDFETVKKWGRPTTVVFNAWGYLDKERDRQFSLEDQEDLERTVRKYFPDAFLDNIGFRVYARKCEQAHDRKIDILDDWGLREFRSYLVDNYLGDFVDNAKRRRFKVIKEVKQISEDASRNLSEYSEAWNSELNRCGAEGARIRADRNQINVIDRRIRSDIRPLAADRSRDILNIIANQAEAFINSTLTMGNWDLWRNSVTKKSREKLEHDLSERFKADFLKLHESDNWLTKSIEDYIQECWPTLDARWRKYIDEIQDEHLDARNPTHRDFRLPFDEIKQASLAGIKSLLGRLLGVGTLLGVLLLIPGGQVVDAVLFGIAFLASLFKDPMERPRQNAIRRFHNEIEAQYLSLKLELVDLIMKGPNNDLATVCKEKISEREKSRGEKESDLISGLEVVEALQRSFIEVYSEEGDEREVA
jgi:GTPase SAR1 family protein